MKRTKQAAKKTLVADAREVIDTCAGINVRLAARRISWFLEERMRATGLNIAQFGLMTHIAAAHDDTIGALAERCGLDQSTLSRNLRLLEREGRVQARSRDAGLARFAYSACRADPARAGAGLGVQDSESREKRGVTFGS